MTKHELILNTIQDSLRLAGGFADEMMAGLEPCTAKGKPHFVRINPTPHNPIGDRVPCPTCGAPTFRVEQ